MFYPSVSGQMRRVRLQPAQPSHPTPATPRYGPHTPHIFINFSNHLLRVGTKFIALNDKAKPKGHQALMIPQSLNPLIPDFSRTAPSQEAEREERLLSPKIHIRLLRSEHLHLILQLPAAQQLREWRAGWVGTSPLWTTQAARISSSS